VPRKAKTHGLKIFYRFHFSSALKRMSVIAGHTPTGSTEVNYIATVKGAPETLRGMVSYLIVIIRTLIDLQMLISFTSFAFNEA